MINQAPQNDFTPEKKTNNSILEKPKILQFNTTHLTQLPLAITFLFLFDLISSPSANDFSLNGTLKKNSARQKIIKK